MQRLAGAVFRFIKLVINYVEGHDLDVTSDSFTKLQKESIISSRRLAITITLFCILVAFVALYFWGLKADSLHFPHVYNNEPFPITVTEQIHPGDTVTYVADFCRRDSNPVDFSVAWRRHDIPTWRAHASFSGVSGEKGCVILPVSWELPDDIQPGVWSIEIHISTQKNWLYDSETTIRSEQFEIFPATTP